MKIFTYTDLSSARIILADKHLFPTSFHTWAKDVLKFFKCLYNAAHYFKGQNLKWGQCLELAWKAVKASARSYKFYMSSRVINGVLIFAQTKQETPVMRIRTTRQYKRA